MAQSAREIRASISSKGRYPSVRSYDCVVLLRLCDAELMALAAIADHGVRVGASLIDMAMHLPADVSRQHLKLFLLACYPDRWRGLGNVPSARRPLELGPAECQVAYTMRRWGVNRRQALDILRAPRVKMERLLA